MRAVVKEDKMRKLRIRLEKLTKQAEQLIPFGCPPDMVATLEGLDDELAARQLEFGKDAAAEVLEKAKAAQAVADDLMAESVRLTTGEPAKMKARGHAPE